MIAALADRPDVRRAETPRQAIAAIGQDLKAFAAEQKLDQLVVINVASTEPVFELGEAHKSLKALNAALERNEPVMPTSSLYAYAAMNA